MDHRLVEGLMEAIAPVIRDSLTAHVEKAAALLVAQITELNGKLAEIEAREPVKGEPGKDGSSVTIDDVRPIIVEAVAAIPAPKDGASVTVDDVRPLLEEMVAAIPKPENGKDADLAEVRLFIAEEVAKIPAPTNGKDADPAAVASLVAAEVERAIAALPPAEPGKSVTPEDVRPIITEEVAKLPQPKDGVGLAGALIDRSGHLVLTLSDGTQRELGAVVGKDGEPGAPGLGFEDMTEELAEDGRTIIRRYTRGEQVKEFRHTMSVVLDKGVWKPGSYVKGDGVTLGGQYFIAQEDTSAEPMTPEAKTAWRLSIKKGRDGKDFRPDGGGSGNSGPVRFK